MSNDYQAEHAAEQKPWLSNRTYDALKWVAQIFLPALGALYFGLSQIWGFPAGAEVVGTITLLDTFLGVLLGLSTKKYNESDAKYDGDVNVEVTPEGKRLSLSLNGDPYYLDQKKDVVLKVNPS